MYETLSLIIVGEWEYSHQYLKKLYTQKHWVKELQKFIWISITKQ